jgi:hypothetical protein
MGLVWLFSALGFAGGLLAALAFVGTQGELGIVADVTFNVTLLSAAVGHFAQRFVRQRSAVGAGFALAATIELAGALAGAASGAMLVVVAGDPQYVGAAILIGGTLGLYFAVGFLVPMGVVFFAARRARCARPGTLVDRSERAGVWAQACFVVAVTWGLVAVASPWGPNARCLGVARAMAVGAAGGLALLVVGDALRLRALRAVRKRVGRVAEADEALQNVEMDLGLGEERWVIEAPATEPYRGGGGKTYIRGTISEVRRLVVRAAIVHGVELGVCAALIACALR